MSDKKKSVKRRIRAIAARDLMSVTGGAGPSTGSSILDPLTVGMFPQGPRPGPLDPLNPFPRPPGGPTIGFNPTGPRTPLK